jgi:serine/threonine protein kinase
MMSVLTKVAHGNLKPIAIGEFCEDVDPYLEALIMKCLAHEPINRPQSMEEVLEELNRMQLRMPQVSMSEAPPSRMSFSGKSIINPDAETMAALSTPQRLEQAENLRIAMRSEPLVVVQGESAKSTGKQRSKQASTVLVKTKKSGDKGLGAIILVFTAAIIGFASWYFWQYLPHQAHEARVTESAVQSSTPNPTVSAATLAGASAVPFAAPSSSKSVNASAGASAVASVVASVTQPAKSAVPPKPTGKRRSFGGYAPLPQPGVDYVPGSDGP